MEDETGPGGPGGDTPPESLLPYDEWTEAALRQVMVRALQYVAVNGLPGEHHFYITFRTDDPDTVIPARLKAQYPEEMTIVLQHQFWDLAMDEAAGLLSVGLSFGGVGSILRIPLRAISGFADPYVRHGMRFSTETPPALPPPALEDTAAPDSTDAAEEIPERDEAPQVVSLDAFRRRTPPKE